MVNKKFVGGKKKARHLEYEARVIKRRLAEQKVEKEREAEREVKI